MKQKNLPALLACFLLYPRIFFTHPLQPATPGIKIDVSTPGPNVPAYLNGFFEVINHSADGGLYGELIQNRGFGSKNIPGDSRPDGLWLMKIDNV